MHGLLYIYQIQMSTGIDTSFISFQSSIYAYILLMAAKENYDALSQQITVTAFLFLLLKTKETKVALTTVVRPCLGELHFKNFNFV
jgi:hypothetical protein